MAEGVCVCGLKVNFVMKIEALFVKQVQLKDNSFVRVDVQFNSVTSPCQKKSLNKQDNWKLSGVSSLFVIACNWDLT